MTLLIARLAMSRVIAITLALSGSVANAQMQPILFMDPLSDTKAAWGLLIGQPNALSHAPGLTSPPVNYSAGATVFASFTTTDPSPASFEVFVAIGRPGEPVASSLDGAYVHVLTRKLAVCTMNWM